MIVISDTTPFSELAKIGSLSLLKAVHGHVIIPQEVYDELLAGPQTVVAAVQSASWVEVRSANRQHVVALRNGIRLSRSALWIESDILTVPFVAKR